MLLWLHNLALDERLGFHCLSSALNMPMILERGAHSLSSVVILTESPVAPRSYLVLLLNSIHEHSLRSQKPRKAEYLRNPEGGCKFSQRCVYVL